MTRKYELKRRAEKQDQTRQRIVEAVVALHEELGPSRTTVSAIAERAGVQRLTVYRHFPDEPSMFEACRNHWLADNPPPDPGSWSTIADPRRRLHQALHEMYAYYGRTERMMTNIARDAALMPAIAEAQQPFLDALEQFNAVLSSGWSVREGQRAFFTAALAHAISFETWRSLVQEQDLTTDEAAELMVLFVDCAAHGELSQQS